MVKTRLNINLNKPTNNINLNKPTNNINLNKPSNINLDKPTQNLRDKEEPGNLRIPGFTDAPGGMVEIGDTGFYITPDEPADPEDCERYPDSLYCGNPLTPQFAGFNFQIVLSPCDVGIRFDPVFGFIKLPPFGLTYRNPNCRNPPQDVPGYERPSFIPPNYNYPIPAPGCTCVATFCFYEDRRGEHPGRIPESITNSPRYECNTYGEQSFCFELDPNNLEEILEEGDHYVEWQDGFRYGDTNSITTFPIGYNFIKTKYIDNGSPYALVETYCLPCSTPPSIFAPPPPPLEPGDQSMSCCPDDLIRLLIQKIDRLSEVVGIDEYPATVPESFISTQGGFLNQEVPIPNIQIASLTKFLEWYVKRFDELMGQWEIPIEVKDSDPTTPGDQGLGFKLPNMAEAIAEMFLLLLQTSINTETLLNMNTRTMLEVGQDKQQNFKSYMLIDAIADYLGFKYDEKKFKLPMLFDIGKEDYAELLKEKETEVTAAEFNDKQNFQEALHRLLEGAAITKSAHFRKLNANTDMKKQIIDIIKNYSKTNKQAQQNDDFDAFIEDVETGFINTPGISDASNPYGRDYSQRPRIREIGNTSDQD